MGSNCGWLDQVAFSTPIKAPTNSSLVTLSSTINPAMFGQAVIFTASVSAAEAGAGTPSGTVQFKTNGVNFGSAVTLSGGNATSSAIATLPAGNTTVTAVYSGNVGFNPGTGTLAGGQTVNPATVTATVTVNNKPYDAKTAASIAHRSLSGVIGNDDVTLGASGTAAFANKNAGTGKLVSVTGLSLAGSAAANYALSAPTASTTANITARPITVTAVADEKVYDGTTSSVGVPQITLGSLANGDTATFTQTYNSKDVLTAHTLTPAGSVSDGNGGNNYAVTFVSIQTESIIPASTTVAVSADKWTVPPTNSVTFSVAVSANAPSTAVPSGTVQFVANGTNNLGSPVTLVNGQAALTVLGSALTHGSNTITAVFSDSNGNFNGCSGDLNPQLL